MGQQVVDGKHGVVRPVAHRDPHHLSVLQRHHAVELQGNGHPLVLPDAAVVVGLEEAQLIALVQGVLLQVQPGGVDVGRPDVDPVLQAFPAHHGQHDGLVPVHLVDPVPGLQLHPPDIGPEAGGLRLGDGPVHALPLGLARVQELLVAGAVRLQRRALLRVQPVPAVLPLIDQGPAELLAPGQFFFFTHKTVLL